MMKIKTFFKKVKNKLWLSAVSAYTLVMLSTPAYAAGDIKDSQIVKGTEKLIGDATTWLMVLAPVVAGLLIIYFCIRRSAADEMDQSATRS